MSVGVYFLDTSALVKLYVAETGSARMLELLRSLGDWRFVILSISLVEFHSAIGRRERARDLGGQSASEVIRAFEIDLESRFTVASTSESVLHDASALADLYPLRALDAIQLAGFITLNVEEPENCVFVCADRRLLQAAKLEGLTCIDPTA